MKERFLEIANSARLAMDKVLSCEKEFGLTSDELADAIEEVRNKAYICLGSMVIGEDGLDSAEECDQVLEISDSIKKDLRAIIDRLADQGID